MITAIVRYKLPAHIGREDCREHFKSITKGFGDAKVPKPKGTTEIPKGWKGPVPFSGSASRLTKAINRKIPDAAIAAALSDRGSKSYVRMCALVS